MTEIAVDARQQTKAAAAQTAVDANNVAASCGICAVIVPQPYAKVGFGVASGVSWLVANYYQRIANDPPRDDFDQVWESGADLDENQMPADEPAATLHRFAARALLTAD